MISVAERKLRQAPLNLKGLKDFPAHHRAGLSTTPTIYDLISRAPKPRNQFNTNECTGFGWTNVRYAWIPQDVRNQLIAKYGSDLLSPQFVYYHERLLEGSVNQDSGAIVEDGGNVLRDIGVCPESLCPFDPTKLSVAPTQEAEAAAAQFKIKDIYRGHGIADVKAALAAGKPVNIGIAVYESFESYDVANFGGIIPMPKQGEKLLGYHDMAIFLSDDHNSWCKTLNSWDNSWGDHGWCYLPYDYLDNPDLCPDIYIIEVDGDVPVIEGPKPWDGMTIDAAIEIMRNCKFSDGTSIMDSPELWLNYAINSRNAQDLSRFEELRIIKEAAFIQQLLKK